MNRKWKIISGIYFLLSMIIIFTLAVWMFGYIGLLHDTSYVLSGCEEGISTVSQAISGRLSKDEVMKIIKKEFPKEYVWESKEKKVLWVRSMAIHFGEDEIVKQIEAY